MARFGEFSGAASGFLQEFFKMIRKFSFDEKFEGRKREGKLKNGEVFYLAVWHYGFYYSKSTPNILEI